MVKWNNIQRDRKKNEWKKNRCGTTHASDYIGNIHNQKHYPESNNKIE